MKITTDYKKQLLDMMSDTYIKGHSSEKDPMESLRLYSHNRLENCQNKDKRNFCSSCSIRCFSKNRREDIKRAMKYSRPGSVFYRPLALLRHTFNHLWRNLSDKQKTYCYDEGFNKICFVHCFIKLDRACF